MTTQFATKRASQTFFIALIAVCYGATLPPAHAQAQTKTKTQYQVSKLPGLGGTNSAGNSLNNQTWVAGYSRLTGDQDPPRYAVAQRFAARPRHTRWTQQQRRMEREKHRGNHRGYFPNSRSGATGGVLE